jgi:hypothetical protein
MARCDLAKGAAQTTTSWRPMARQFKPYRHLAVDDGRCQGRRDCGASSLTLAPSAYDLVQEIETFLNSNRITLHHED